MDVVLDTSTLEECFDRYEDASTSNLLVELDSRAIEKISEADFVLPVYEPQKLISDYTKAATILMKKNYGPRVNDLIFILKLDGIKNNDIERVYLKYIAGAVNWPNEPGLFMDMADYFIDVVMNKNLGLRILSNIAELKLENAQFLRVIAYKMEQLGQIDQAIKVFEKVLSLRGEEPQSYRDLALALAKQGNLKAIERSISLLKKVVESEWDKRFNQIEQTTLVDVNRLIILAKLYKFDYVSPLTDNFILPFDLDIRIVLGWDLDMTDIDLLVEEPTGELCYSFYNNTKIGGMLSKDFTNGYGPEEYCLRKAVRGKYIVKAKFAPTIGDKKNLHCICEDLYKFWTSRK